MYKPRWKFDELVSLEEERQPHAEHITEQGAHHADDRALKHEDPADHPLVAPMDIRDGDVRLFHDQHDQRGDDGEGADEDDHRQQDEHADFSSFNAAKRLRSCPSMSGRKPEAELLLRAAATVSALPSLTVT